MIPLFVTVDTEGDNGWDRPKKILTTNSNGISRFQQLCESYGVKPIYLVNYEMAMDDILVSSLKEKNLKGLCEIGMHMHAWNNPPMYDLTEDDFANLPFATEYPLEILDKKVYAVTSLLEERFGTEIISHRSGRWIVNNDYLDVLIKYGYKVDCSYTPLIDWTCSKGDPNGMGGVDYTRCKNTPNVINLKNGDILEIPMSTMKNNTYNNILVNKIMDICPENIKKTKVYNALNGRKVIMLRPDIRREKLQMKLIQKLSTDKTLQHVELMIHSSELYKGTCPHCKTDADIDILYSIIGKMFDELSKFCESKTFKEYAKV